MMLTIFAGATSNTHLTCLNWEAPLITSFKGPQWLVQEMLTLPDIHRLAKALG